MKTSEAVPRIKVQKKNPAGEVTYEYEGLLLQHDEHSIVLEAFFDRADMPFLDVVFKTGDRFVEYYYTDRWYNIFAVYDRDDRTVKGLVLQHRQTSCIRRRCCLLYRSCTGSVGFHQRETNGFG